MTAPAANTPLPKPLRSQLEAAVKAARDVAEKAAGAALAQLAVADAKLPDYLTDETLRSLRRRLRAHAKALGDERKGNGQQDTRRLVWEVAYEHWHRMLFARFLAENGLLLWEPGAPVSLEDCRNIVDHHPEMLQGALAAKTQWELAAKLAAEHQPELWDDTSATWDNALTALGLLDAARLQDGRYHLVVTNVPYLARGKQHDTLKDYCEAHYPEAKNDLANVFLERCLELSRGQGSGVVQIVMPQNWLFLSSYKKQRASLLKSVQWNLLARLGEGGFDSQQAAGAFIILLTQTNAPAAAGFQLRGVDASVPKVATEKAAILRGGDLAAVSQAGQLGNPDARITLEQLETGPLLDTFASSLQGVKTGDDARLKRSFWEVTRAERWALAQSGPVDDDFGCYWSCLDWRNGGQLMARLQGQAAFGRRGVAISTVRRIVSFPYFGQPFTSELAVIVPQKQELATAVLALCESQEYEAAVRALDQKLAITNATLGKVPFELRRWQEVAAERYPNGLPKPYSEDPTQWLFHGHPQPATDPLQVAVARLVGYRWPAETDTAMELADEARTWIARCEQLAEHTDDDGILCLPSVRGEAPAHDRLLKLLIAAWETVQPGSWKPAVLDKLLLEADCAGKGLDVWLRDKFFEQHAKRFHHRPFIWHVWDGLKDGFAALVNVHKLDTKNLERLIHTYLGDWIRKQEAGVRSGVDGAPTRLAAAQDLKRRLELILEGEPPYDIFVRWKPLAEQPIGWNPDLNDGVRLNIRPFMTAEVLRHNKKPKLNITWDKDRGKDVESAPWFKVFKGDRINDHHLALAEKIAAQGD